MERLAEERPLGLGLQDGRHVERRKGCARLTEGPEHRLRSGYNDTREVPLSRGLKCRLGGQTGGGEVRA